MSPSAPTLRRLEEVLERLEPLDSHERARVLEALDSPLRSLVEDFFRSEREADEALFLGIPLGTPPETPLETPLSTGDRLGAYRLEEPIGEGGSSVVYRATRADEAYSQEVAIKVLRRGLGAERRFLAERQLLAELEHPGIARLLDGGATPDGVHYLVMERVRGRPLDRWCDERRLSVEARLELLLEVCEIVAWAHRRLVVHRDLKPSNILVTDEGRPRLLDFGIAKLLEGRRPGAAVITAPWVRILTPEYASPEQLRGESPTAATDVYSLGVLLHQVLTGERPHSLDDETDDEETAGAGRLEAFERRLRTPPPPISRRVVDGSVEAHERARRRQLDPKALARRLRGDLDGIVAQALHPDLERRYATAQHLADDLRRHLEGRPVAARPDSLAYRLGKTVRRHPGASAFAILFVVAVLSSAIILGVAATRLEAQRDIARFERDANARLVQVLRDLWIRADPWTSSDEPPSVLSLLDEGREGLDAFDEVPRIQAPLLVTLGRVYVEHGEIERGAALLERAVEIFRSTPPADPALEVEALNALGIARHAEKRFPEAAALHRRALGILHATRPGSERVARTLTFLAVTLERQGEAEEAIERLHEALEIFAARPTAEPISHGLTWSHLAVAQGNAGRLDRARHAIDRSLEILRGHLSPDHPLVARARSHGAMIELRQGRPEASEAILREVLAILEVRLGADHPETLRNTGNLALVVAARGRDEEAEQLWRDVEERARRVHGDAHPLVDWLARRGQAPGPTIEIES